jgi:hypothetical protein
VQKEKNNDLNPLYRNIYGTNEVDDLSREERIEDNKNGMETRS